MRQGIDTHQGLTDFNKAVRRDAFDPAVDRKIVFHGSHQRNRADLHVLRLLMVMQKTMTVLLGLRCHILIVFIIDRSGLELDDADAVFA